MKITLVASDGQTIETNSDVLSMSLTFKAITINTAASNTTAAQGGYRIAVPCSNSEILRIVVQLCENYRQNASQLNDNLLGTDQAVLFEIAVAANSLGITKLRQDVHKKIALQMQVELNKKVDLKYLIAITVGPFFAFLPSAIAYMTPDSLQNSTAGQIGAWGAAISGVLLIGFGAVKFGPRCVSRVFGN